MNATGTQTLAAMWANGDLDGYRRRPERRGGEIDRAICRDSRCPQCGHVGLEYHGFDKPGSYRAFAVCPECDTAEEF